MTLRTIVCNMTNAQVKLAFTYMDRIKLDSDYRMLRSSERYVRMHGLVNNTIRDPLIAKDIGVEDLRAVRAYFEACVMRALREEALS